MNINNYDIIDLTVENLANTDKLPPTGAQIIALPMKVKDGPEAPMRIIALIEKMPDK